MEYKLSKRLKNSIQKEIEGKGCNNRNVVFGAMAQEVFKDVKSTAILTGDKLELFSFD
ncbi:MAG: hypothetical protein ACTIJ9_10040 [Aequorivita sp.]